MNNRGSVRLSKKTYLITAGTVLGIVLIAWVILIVGIFKKDKKPQKNASTEPGIVKYDLPEIPDGYELVFRKTGFYKMSDNGTKTYMQKWTYDDAGNCLSETDFEKDGKTVVFAVESEYDEENREIKRTEYDGDRNVTRQIFRKYDSDGRLAESVDSTYEYSEYEESEGPHYTSTEETVFYYDEKGKKIKQETKVNRSVFGEEESYAFISEWDENGKPLTEGIKGAYGIGIVYKVYRYEYDAYGNLREKAWRWGNSKSEEYIVSERDYYANENGTQRLIQHIEYSNDTTEPPAGGFGNAKVYDYEGNKQLVRYTEYTDGIPVEETKYVNDSKGNVLHAVTYQYQIDGDRKNITVRETVNTYDTAGKLLTSVTTEDGKVIEEIATGDGEKKTITYKYNEYGKKFRDSVVTTNGNSVKRLDYDENGKITQDRTTEYDSDGNIIKILKYSKGVFEAWYEYQDYVQVESESGKTTSKPRKIITRNEDGTVQSTLEQQYYEKEKKLIGRIEYKADGTRNESEVGYYCEFDEYGNIAREICYNIPSAGVTTLCVYEYQPFAVKKNSSGE